MKSRSVSGFIFGLLSVILGVPIGYLSFAVLTLTFALTNNIVFVSSVYLIAFALISALIGICFYFHRARFGCVFMFLAFILYVIPHALFLYVAYSSVEIPEPNSVIVQTLLFLVPALLMFVSGIFGARSKRKKAQI